MPRSIPCPVTDCDGDADGDAPFCRSHWRALPEPLRIALDDARRRRDRPDWRAAGLAAKRWFADRAAIAADVGQADDDGWRDWSGGDCPVAPSDAVLVRIRGGVAGSLGECRPGPARGWRWTHDGGPGDIVAWRRG